MKIERENLSLPMSVLIVDDDFDFVEALKMFLAENSIEAHSVSSSESCHELLRTKSFDVAIIEQNISDGQSGLELLKDLKNQFPAMQLLFISRLGDVESAVNAIKLGAREYYRRPFDFEILLPKLNQIEDEVKIKSTSGQAESQDPKETYRFENLSSNNLRTQKIIDEARSFAQTDINILLTGESGTGKGLLARTIHYNSPRWKGPFVELNSSAIPSTLIESELFGHEKGAFTDARETRQGLLEMAHGSTLFLDEISTMDYNMQSKLLKVIEDFKFYRIGGRKEITVNVRLITATNADLKKLVDDSKFREDLFYRLNVATIQIPPLRERKEDIIEIFMKYVKIFNTNFKRDVKNLSEPVREILESYSWHGNIRELRNVCERIMITIRGNTIEEHHLPLEIVKAYKESVVGDQFKSLKEIEREHIKKTLAAFNGNKTKAALALGISRTALIYKVKEYEIQSYQS